MTIRRTSITWILSLVIAVGLISCSDSIKQESPVISYPEGCILKTFLFRAGPGTRSFVMNEDETRTVRSLCVMAFREGSLVEKQESKEGQVSMRLYCSQVGVRYTFYAFVNTEGRVDFSSVNKEEDLSSLSFGYESVTPDNVVMAGELTEYLTTSSSEIDIPVTRSVSYLKFGTVAAEFDNFVFGHRRLVLDRIYVLNASKRETLSLERSGHEYYNRYDGREVQMDGPPSLADDIGRELNSEEGVSVPFAADRQYLLFPNDGADCSTFLVLECHHGGVKTYYSINLNSLSNQEGSLRVNCSYLINRMTITGPGTDRPDEQVQRVSAGITVRVTDWKTGMSENVSI